MRFGPEDITPPPEHDLSSTVQQERKHTEEEVQEILEVYAEQYYDTEKVPDEVVRRILGVPAP